MRVHDTNLGIPGGRTQAARPLRCWLLALLSGWVTTVFGASALIVLRSVPNAMTRSGLGSPGWLPATWRVADEMAPAAKLLLVALVAILLWLGERSVPQSPGTDGSARWWWPYVRNGVLGATAMLLTLALVPTTFSRGFGVGLTGARFDPMTLPLYLLSAGLGAIVYTFSVTRCRAAAADPHRRDGTGF